jgi:predicted alpha/beta superfamily hydrolase
VKPRLEVAGVAELDAEQIADEQYEVRHWLSAGHYHCRWRFPDGETWGGHGTESLIAPSSGQAEVDGEPMLLNVVVAGEFTFNLDLRSHRWLIERISDDPLLDEALSVNSEARGRMREVLASLRQHGDGKPFGFDWNDWSRLEPFLRQGAYRGFLPVREGHRVLFVFNGALHDSLYLAGSMNGWSVGPDRFDRVPHTDVHLLYRELDPSQQHQYKLHHAGAWFADPYNRWITPDGQPIPLFQTGTFNSVIDLGMPTCSRGENALWVQFSSMLRGHVRDIYIYLPPSYASRPRDHFPVLYVQDGNEAFTRAWLHTRARETFEAGWAEECIIVFIGLASQLERNYEYSDEDGREHYADFLARELVPFIDSQLRTRAQASGRGVVGASYGGYISYFVGWRHPKVFGKIAGQGTSFWLGDWDVLHLYVQSPRRRLQLYMDSAYPSYSSAPRDNYLGARYAERTLRAAGYRVRHVQRKNQRHDWSSWRERFPEVLRTFWPLA